MFVVTNAQIWRLSIGSGPLPVSFARTVSGIEPVLQKALGALGVPLNDDGVSPQMRLSQ